MTEKKQGIERNGEYVAVHMKLKSGSNNIRYCLWKHDLHSIYKSMHGTDKPKMKDDVCLSQDREMNGIGKLL